MILSSGVAREVRRRQSVRAARLFPFLSGDGNIVNVDDVDDDGYGDNDDNDDGWERQQTQGSPRVSNVIVTPLIIANTQ